MVEPLDADLLKDLRGLGKPLTFDGNDAEYQGFRFTFRIHMSLVSSASQTLMDKCEAEPNPMSLTPVRALGEPSLKCSIQMCYSLALITKGSARTFVRYVEESDGAEAWRLIHNRYAPDTQNRQYALMQKIMMPAKLWCDHAEGFESGLRVRELDVGEWQRASGTARADAVKVHTDDEYGTQFSLGAVCSWVLMPTVPLFTQLCCNSVIITETLEHPRPCQLEMEQVRMMTTGCKSTLSRKARGRTKANTKTRKELSQKQHKQYKQHRHQHVQELW